MIANPVRWFEIYVQDMSRATAFYEAVFNTKLEKLQAPDGVNLWAFPMSKEQGGCAGALVHIEGMSSGGTSTIVYFSSDDCQIETTKAKANGGKIHKEKFSIGQYGHIALMFDTEGNMIGVHSMK